MARKFKIKDEPYTRTIVKKDGDETVVENKEYDIQDSIKALDINISYNFQYIPLEKIEPNPLNEAYRNITSENDIRMLADSIAAYGMGTNLVLKKNPGEDVYTLISGESRTRALKKLLTEGINVFPKGVPSNIIVGDLSQDDEAIMIDIYNIMSRRYQPEKYIGLVAEFEKRLRRTAKKEGKKLTNINRLISDLAGISERMTRRIRSYNINLVPELISALEEKKITQMDADTYVKLSKDDQEIVVEYLEEDKVLTLDEVESIKEVKNELQKVEVEDKVVNNVDGDEPEYVSNKTNSSGGVSSIRIDTDKGVKDQLKSDINKKSGSNKMPSLDNPAVKRNILERDLDKLSKRLKRMIIEFINKEDEYRNNYEGDSEKYGTLVDALKEIANGD